MTILISSSITKIGQEPGYVSQRRHDVVVALVFANQIGALRQFVIGGEVKHLHKTVANPRETSLSRILHLFILFVGS